MFYFYYYYLNSNNQKSVRPWRVPSSKLKFECMISWFTWLCCLPYDLVTFVLKDTRVLLEAFQNDRHSNKSFISLINETDVECASSWIMIAICNVQGKPNMTSHSAHAHFADMTSYPGFPLHVRMMRGFPFSLLALFTNLHTEAITHART